MSIDQDTPPVATTIWQELDTWAQGFKPWQRYILATAVRIGSLTDQHIDQAYALFLHDTGLGNAPTPPIEVPATITGRPSDAALIPIWLTRVGDLKSINALPRASELLFSPRLTVVYGGNGVGKSGFTRLLSNVCFSRKQHQILANVYEETPAQRPGATIVISNGNQEKTPFAFDGENEHSDLKRIAVFDTAVARTHLVDQSPLGFKPAGFDVFPEMARVYAQIGARLTTDTERRKKENTFTKSFVAPESPVSQFVASLNADTDLPQLRRMAVFGETESARFDEVQRQINELRAKSPAEAIKQLEAAKRDVTALTQHLAQCDHLLGEEKRVEYRAQLRDFIVKARAVVTQGAESFKTDYLKSVGSAEWERFLASAQTLAPLEHAHYPNDNDHCLLCQRPLDAVSAALIRRFWEFLASDIRQESEKANAILNASVKALRALRLDFFALETTAHAHLVRLDPAIAKQITDHILSLDRDRAAIVDVLENATGTIEPSALGGIVAPLTLLVAQIDADIARIKELKIEDAIKALESERVALRHRQVLNQLLPEIEKFVNDLSWAKKASGSARSNLNPRPLTAKESELFTTVIAENYRTRLAEECALLDCDLPVEFRTQGQRGQTVRSLTIKGRHSPDAILSEGEQRAVALADFLTEVCINPANAGIVLDDPVTSQDHQRKERIAHRLVCEAKNRQIIIFTHDLVFLTMLATAAEAETVEILTHWIERDGNGCPGQVSLDDSPATTPQYRKTTKAKDTLQEAKKASGSDRLRLIQRGMGELRRTIEEIVPHFLFKQVVNRWTDRVIVTGLKKVKWDDRLIDDIIATYENISAYIEGHSHTDERTGAPPEPNHLEEMIARVDDLINRAKPERK